MDRPVPINNRRFHTLAACTFAAFLLFAVIGCWQAEIIVPYLGLRILLRCICVAILSPLPIYWDIKHRPDRRKAALAPIWMLAFAFTLPSLVNICARSNLPLQDATLVHLDNLLGFNVPAISEWFRLHHWAHAVNHAYGTLTYLLLPLAVFAPAVFGRWLAAREFLAANVIALIIGFAAFALVPAIGPWYGYNGPASAGQQFCQDQLLMLRDPGPVMVQAAGIVCFPSFHVIWAILCARALWTFRLLRIPVGLLAGLIILSTITTGWHYLVDVIAGFLIAYISLRLAAPVLGRQAQPVAQPSNP